jgi:hypothetical protein
MRPYAAAALLLHHSPGHDVVVFRSAVILSHDHPTTLFKKGTTRHPTGLVTLLDIASDIDVEEGHSSPSH